ncbi:MAG: S8 family serine peptidase [Rhodanobacteraceae bacterium]|jgi:subtilisin family serine protease|nr:S8 family serine peptidase [Rhodanobacteraceae bacterium]
MTLTSAIGIALAGAGMQAVADAARPYQLTDVASDAANVDGTYIITFAEAGLFNYEGGVSGFARTAPNKASGERKLDRTSQAARSYEAYLEAQRAVHRTAIENAIKRPLDVTHSYGITFNGVAASLSPEEAAEIAKLPGIESVRPAGVYHLDTYRGPAFIGADKIWDGSGTPSGVGTKGQGVKVGVIDGGANSTHPSFANDPTCGLSASVPKLTARDCSTSAGGICNGPDPEANPTYGHGVHTASTVAGNTIDNTANPPPSLPDGTTMSGVAPCAQVFQYKVCPTNSCGGAAIAAGIQNAIADGVDAINFSISGGTSPWSSSESDRMFLDAVDAGIFVAASAGNTSTTITNPVGQVNHRGPWVMTVAASTHDEKIGPTLWAAGPGTPPPATQKIALNPGSTTDSGATTDLTGMPIADYPANLIGCTANGGFPANHFQGKIAVVRRGTCPFTEKITNAANAGASMVLIANNQVGSINMDTTGAPAVPAFSLDQVSGDALIAFIDANPPGTVDPDVIFKDGFDGAAAPTGATANYRRVAAASRQGDVLADFSFRGPTPAPLADLSKPDITAPGVDIYAATDPASGQYEFLSGTSMSGPHVAGSGALMKAVHPDWTPMEIRSALMMTAKSDGFQENGTTPWNIDDVGSGRVRVDQAARAGLTMNETKANFLAADPSGGSITVKELNVPSLRNMACNGTCTWTRKVKNRLATSGNWTVTTVTDPAFSVTVSPSTFNLAPGAEQTLTFTASPSANITAPKFGYVTLKENGGLSPDQRITVAIKGTAGGLPIIAVAPTSLSSTQATNTTQTKTLTVSNTGGGSLSWSVSATGTGSIWNQPQNGSSGIVSSYSSTDNGGGFTAADFQVSATSNIKKIKVFGFDNTSTLANQPKITWRIYGDASGSPAGNPDTNTGTPVWTFDSAPNGAGVSLADTGVITLDLVAAGQTLNLPAGTYWLTVYPTYANAIGPAGSARWNWFQADQQGGPAKLVGTMFGVNNWTAIGSLGTAYTDVAFTIDGDITCGAPWLSLSPTSGNVSGGGNATVTATFNSNGLAAGTYNASACIASNDASNPVVTVPVTLTVDAGGGSCNPVQLFKDPSLEQTSTFWTATDSVFGDPWCDSTCDSNGTIGPHSGNMFAWIGGTATAGTGTLGQSVVFPSGQARWLNFWMIDQLGSLATLKLTIDGTQVTTFAAGTPSQTYVQKSFQIPAQYLDGQSHNVQFNYAKSAGTTVSGVMLDDVTLDCSAAPSGAAPATEPVSATARGRMH